MIIPGKIIVKPLCGIAFVLLVFKAEAQVTLLQNAISKLESYQSFSYRYTEKTQDFNTSDTTLKLHGDRFQKAPGGYLYRLETEQTDNGYHAIILYNGRDFIHLAPADSTYEYPDRQKNEPGATFSSLLPFLKWLSARPEKQPARMAADTMIAGTACHHLIFDIYDTVINKEHALTLIHVLINQRSGLPDAIITRERVPGFGSGLTSFFAEYDYSDYQFNEGADLAAQTVPAGFHLPKARTVLPLLAPETAAPEWTLSATDGKKISLAGFRGKVVLLDFFFIGCGACMESLSALHNLHEKYKDRGDFVLVSISTRDGQKRLSEFKKNYGIKNTMCSNGAAIAESYHLSGAPVFYFIDKDGKIGGVIDGFAPGFESNAAQTIERLLTKEK